MLRHASKSALPGSSRQAKITGFDAPFLTSFQAIVVPFDARNFGRTSFVDIKDAFKTVLMSLIFTGLQFGGKFGKGNSSRDQANEEK